MGDSRCDDHRLMLIEWHPLMLIDLTLLWKGTQGTICADTYVCD